jgi:hypothetical protein
MTEKFLGTGYRNDPGNIKGTDGRSNFVLGKGNRRTPLKVKHLRNVRSDLFMQVVKRNSLFS